MPFAPAYAGEEAVFGEDGHCVQEEDGDVDEGAEAEEGYHCGSGEGVVGVGWGGGLRQKSL